MCFLILTYKVNNLFFFMQILIVNRCLIKKNFTRLILLLLSKIDSISVFPLKKV